jgi:hypothetical protein
MSSSRPTSCGAALQTPGEEGDEKSLFGVHPVLRLVTDDRVRPVEHGVDDLVTAMSW